MTGRSSKGEHLDNIVSVDKFVISYFSSRLDGSLTHLSRTTKQKTCFSETFSSFQSLASLSRKKYIEHISLANFLTINKHIELSIS